MVFDVTDPTSLENLNAYWIPKIIENADECIELVIVGNKTDLINVRSITEEQI